MPPKKRRLLARTICGKAFLPRPAANCWAHFSVRKHGLNMPTITLPEVETAEKSGTEQQRAPRYHVVLFDDDSHTYEYVIEMMVNLFAMTIERGFEVAYEVDHIGQAIVKTCPHDEAVEARKLIISYGPDPRMDNSTGSMACMIERADE